MVKNQIKLLAALLLPMVANAQISIFNDGEATAEAIGNMAHNASTGTEAAIYNPAGLSFAPGKFAVSVNGIANYQQVRCLPFSLDENGEKVYGWEQTATLRKASPSIQGYAKIKKGTISFSYADEGGLKWNDPDGNIIMNYYLENHSELEYLSSMIQESLQENGYLANDDDCLHWSTSNFMSQSYNRCVRLGGSYDLGRGFAAYLGVRYNHIKATESSDNDLFVFIPSRQQKVNFVNYLEDVIKSMSFGELSDEQEQNLHNIDSILDNGVQISYDYPITNLHTFSPVLGLAFSYRTLNVGMRYEMSPSVLGETGGLFLPHVVSVGVSNLFWEKLLVSASSDLKWGFKGNDALKFIAENKPFVYQVALGLDYNVTDQFKISASAAGGNTVLFTCLGDNCSIEYISSSRWNYKVSCGMQCKIGSSFLVDFGMMMNLRKTNVNESVTINNDSKQNCLFQYGYRFASGLGLTYVFN